MLILSKSVLHIDSILAVTFVTFVGVILGMFNGYVTFVGSILLIGVVTAVIGDVAAQLGCFIYLKDSVNAIAFVALGTSVPGS